MHKNLSAAEAHKLLQASSACVYLDVRTVEEFAAGRPAGATNIPLLLGDPRLGQPRPNERFLAVVEAHFKKDRKLVVGCKSGGRSVVACKLLSDAGYQNLWNVQGGYAGHTDPSGRVIDQGWSTLGLPSESGDAGEGQYKALVKKMDG